MLAVRRAEFDRWRKVLADRPSDREIATWLTVTGRSFLIGRCGITG
ncbi:hypothetical protein MXD62_06025 [Frankia sp. Mgl5]|nr:hypothetical protein [Frankia sp. Mgl5]MCK9926727.1 hypothetical protein [Frankia sp. Mgl5]